MTQPTHFQIISPADGLVYAERPYQQLTEAATIADHARRAQRDWAKRPIAERARYCSAIVDALLADGERIASELTAQMGRPISQSPGELRGFEERARYMIEIAEESLAPVIPTPKAGFTRSIQGLGVGVARRGPSGTRSPRTWRKRSPRTARTTNGTARPRRRLLGRRSGSRPARRRRAVEAHL